MACRRLVGWTVRALRVLVLVPVLVTVAALIAVQTGWGRALLRDLIVARLDEALSGYVQIAQLDGNPLHELTLQRVVLRDLTGEPLLRADVLSLRYSVRGLLHHRVDSLRVEGAKLSRGALAALERASRLRAGPSRPLRIEAIHLGVVSPLPATVDARLQIDQQETTLRVEGHGDAEALARLARLPVATTGRVALQLALRSRAGALQLDGRLRSAAGDVTIAGGLDAAHALRLDVSGEPLDPAPLLVGAPHARLALAAHLGGTVEQPTGRLELRGDAAGALGTLEGELRGDGTMEARAWFGSDELSRLGVAGLAGRLNGRVELRRAQQTRVSLTLAGSGLRFRGVRARQLSAVADTLDLGGSVHVDARGLAVGVRQLGKVALRARGDVHGQQVALRLSGGAATLALQLRGWPRVAHGRLRGWNARVDQALVSLGELRWHNLRAGALRVDRTLTLDELVMARGEERVALRGRLWPRDGRLDVALDGERLDVRRVWALLPTRAPLPLARLDAHAHLAGTVTRPRVDVALHGERGAGRPPIDGELSLVTGPRASAALHVSLPLDGGGRVEARVRAPVQLGAGRPWLADAPLEGSAELHQVDLTWPGQPIGVIVDGTLALGGTGRAPTLTGELSGSTSGVHGTSHVAARLDWSRVARLDLTLGHGGVAVAQVHAEAPFDLAELPDPSAWRARPLSADGTVRLQTATLRALGLPLDGAIAGTLSLRGSLLHPRALLALSGGGLQLAGDPLSACDVRLQLEGQRLDASLQATERAGGTVSFAGAARLSASGAQPLSGQLWVKGLTVTLPGNSRRYKLDAHAQLDGDAIAIEQLRAVHADSGITAKGRVRLDGVTPKSVDARVSAAHLPLVHGKVAAWLDGDLSLHVERARGRALAGAVTLERGTARLGRVAADQTLQDVEPLADVRYVDAAPDDAGVELTLHRMGASMSLAGTIPGPFHVESPDLHVDLRGRLAVEGGAGPVVTRGVVEALPGGWIELYGRRFAIAGTTLSFDGARPPAIALRLTRERPEATIVIELRGPLDHPKVTLSSQPPIYDPAQLAALVVSGDPSAVRGDSSQVEQMTAALSGALVGQLKSELLPQLPVDTLKVEGARIEAGKLLGERLYVAYVHQTVAPSDARHMNANQAQLEVRLPLGLRIETMYGDGSVGSIDVSWTRRY